MKDVIVLLTDGATVTEDKNALFAVMPSVLQQATVLSVGIGDINLQEMQQIVTPPFDNNFLQVGDFDELFGNVDRFYQSLITAITSIESFIFNRRRPFCDGK